MKKRILNTKIGKILLAVSCLVLAIILWFFVKLIEYGASDAVSLIFS